MFSSIYIRYEHYLWLQAKSVPWLPNIVLGVITIVVGLACLLLPETKDWPLPMSIADVYRYSRGEFRSRRHTKTEEETEMIWISSSKQFRYITFIHWGYRGNCRLWTNSIDFPNDMII